MGGCGFCGAGGLLISSFVLSSLHGVGGLFFFLSERDLIDSLSLARWRPNARAQQLESD